MIIWIENLNKYLNFGEISAQIAYYNIFVHFLLFHLF